MGHTGFWALGIFWNEIAARAGTCLARHRPVTSRPVPIAVVFTSFDPGGTERQMTELVRRLDRTRFSVHVACLHRRGAWLPHVESVATSVEEFPLRSFGHWSAATAIARFARWCRRRRIRIVQTTDLYTNIVGLPGAALAGVPVRIGSRRELAPPDKTSSLRALQRFAYAAAHRIVANSQAAVDQLVAEGVAPFRAVRIPNGIDLNRYPEAQPPAGPPRVTMVANLREEKGHDVLVRAAGAVRRRIPAVRFELVGDGPLRDRIAAQAKQEGVLDVFDFLGHREDVPALLCASHAFVLPSRTEASPNCVIEAMATGLPVVTTAVGGLLELIEHGRNGLLVPVNDDRALAAALIDVLEQPLVAAALGRTARLTVAARYAFERMVASFEDLYDRELVDRRVIAPRVPEALVS